MALNFCRRFITTIKKPCVIFNLQPLHSHQTAVLSRLLIDPKSIPSTGFCTEKRPRLGLRRQKLPPYPHIDVVRDLDLKTFLPSHYKIVKHFDYEFLESEDGYVTVYIESYHHPRNIDAKSGFSVYFGKNHPLNLQGPVPRRQSDNHAKLYAFLKIFDQIPENLVSKLCICVNQLAFTTFINSSLRDMSENSFRSIHTGRLNKDIETSIDINRVLRTRHDLTLRLKYVPGNVGVDGLYQARKIATKAAEQATRESKQHLRLIPFDE